MNEKQCVHNKTMKRPSWDQYFLEICKTVAIRSLDVNTRLGCVIVDKRKRIVSTGYNSLPAGVNDEFWPMDRDSKVYFVKYMNGTEICDESRIKYIKNKYNNIEIQEITKYDVVVHAEINAISSSKGDLTGFTLYCNYMPCAECAKSIISAGIKRVVYSIENPRFERSHAIAKQMFNESGVIHEKIVQRNK